MADVLIVGDGPGGLSAALFLAKKDQEVVVFGQDKTPMHSAMLYNYLGIPEITGSDFQRQARQQVEGFGARLLDAEAAAVEKTAEGFAVTTAEGERYEGAYLILATGPKRQLAESLGLAMNADRGVDADRDGRTAVENLYVIGWATRPQRIQAIISAGDGAAAALSILSRQAGKDFHDFDVV